MGVAFEFLGGNRLYSSKELWLKFAENIIGYVSWEEWSYFFFQHSQAPAQVKAELEPSGPWAPPQKLESRRESSSQGHLLLSGQAGCASVPTPVSCPLRGSRVAILQLCSTPLALTQSERRSRYRASHCPKKRPYLCPRKNV